MKFLHNYLGRLNAIYPVGSIYISTNNNSPQNFLGGTWERIEGRFLLGAGSGYNAGSTGGEATKTLTTNNIPSHTHSVTVAGYRSTYNQGTTNWAGTNATTYLLRYVNQSTFSGYGLAENIRLNTTGSGNSFSIMPPYLAVYIRKRTA